MTISIFACACAFARACACACACACVCVRVCVCQPLRAQRNARRAGLTTKNVTTHPTTCVRDRGRSKSHINPIELHTSCWEVDRRPPPPCGTLWVACFASPCNHVHAWQPHDLVFPTRAPWLHHPGTARMCGGAREQRKEGAGVVREDLGAPPRAVNGGGRCLKRRPGHNLCT